MIRFASKGQVRLARDCPRAFGDSYRPLRTLCFCSPAVRFPYRKIPITSRGLIFGQKTFLLGLFSEGLIIAFQNGLGLTIKTG